MKSWFTALHNEITGNDHSFKQAKEEQERSRPQPIQRRDSTAFLGRRGSNASLLSTDTGPQARRGSVGAALGRKGSVASLESQGRRHSSATLTLAAETLLKQFQDMPHVQEALSRASTPNSRSSATASTHGSQRQKAVLEEEEEGHRVDMDRVTALLHDGLAWRPKATVATAARELAAEETAAAWGGTPPGTPPPNSLRPFQPIPAAYAKASQAQKGARGGKEPPMRKPFVRSEATELRVGSRALLSELSSHPELNGTEVELLKWDPSVGRWVVGLMGYASTSDGPRVLPENLVPLAPASDASKDSADADKASAKDDPSLPTGVPSEAEPQLGAKREERPQEDQQKGHGEQQQEEREETGEMNVDAPADIAYLTSTRGFGALRLGPGSDLLMKALPDAELEQQLREKIRKASSRWEWVKPKDSPGFYAQREAT
mmetsp:Transcript_2327/g.4878  ORF Transcript_2327/g.4878 Transcript_2327/m.4878 type:complete len:433 (+) Transcript_2327:240-1538(+)